MVKKIGACSNNIEHGQNIFELADGIGIKNNKISNSNNQSSKPLRDI